MFNKIKRFILDYLTQNQKQSLNIHIEKKLEKYIAARGIPNFIDFNFAKLKEETLSFVKSMQCGNVYEYKYAPSTNRPNIYSSVYACLILFMYGDLDKQDEQFKKGWAEYFDSFQDPETGMFYDQTIRSEYYDNSDWWGARHLCPHIISAYTSLGYKPKYDFKWLAPYYNTEKLIELLDSVNWNSAIPDENDIDNKIMNIGTALQYQRDFFADEKAAMSVKYMEDYLINHRNQNTGLWGKYNTKDPEELPRMIQFSYHLLRILMYDNIDLNKKETIIDLILLSQNIYGGFGRKLNSSACEDIDAIDLLLYFSRQTTYRASDIFKAAQHTLIFVLSNQNNDGGFVFRRDEAFWYGCDEMTSKINESAMFPTWFRTLCLAYITSILDLPNFNRVKCPGY